MLLLIEASAQIEWGGFTWYFKKKHPRIAEEYIRKHKKGAIIFGKFLPVIRPFSPVIAGTTECRFVHFFRFL